MKTILAHCDMGTEGSNKNKVTYVNYTASAFYVLRHFELQPRRERQYWHVCVLSSPGVKSRVDKIKVEDEKKTKWGGLY